MKVAHADAQQPTLVNLGDTQQIREIGPPTNERDAAAKQAKLDWLILCGIAHRSCAGGGRPRHGDPFVRFVARRCRGSPGANRRPGRNWTTRSPRRSWATGSGRGNGAGRGEGSDRAHGPAGTRWHGGGGWCSGAGWCDRSDWSERHGRCEHDDTRNPGALSGRSACRHGRYCHCDLPPRCVCARGWCAGFCARSREQERRAAVVVPNEHQRMAGRGIRDRSARRGRADDGATLCALRKDVT